MRKAAEQSRVPSEEGREAQAVTTLDEAELGERDREFLLDPLVLVYWPSERWAILTYRAELDRKLEQDVETREVVRSWEAGAGSLWRKEKMRVDGQRQLQEIEQHKYVLSQQLGYDVGWEQAATDWIEHHAGAWRRWWETQPLSHPRMP